MSNGVVSGIDCQKILKNNCVLLAVKVNKQDYLLEQVRGPRGLLDLVHADLCGSIEVSSIG